MQIPLRDIVRRDKASTCQLYISTLSAIALQSTPSMLNLTFKPSINHNLTVPDCAKRHSLMPASLFYPSQARDLSTEHGSPEGLSWQHPGAA